ncbi:GroES-like protein [Astrocystis sublimbata]|nr:GroES-like protein [Astrocystis sublimbata]
MKTKAYVVSEKGAPFVLTDVILDDELRPDEVLVEMKYTGLCHTDIVVQQGHMPVGCYPAVLGHEGCGIVRKLGSGVSGTSALAVGDAVLLSFHCCGECTACIKGSTGSCPRMGEINFVKTARERDQLKDGTVSSPSSPISLPDGTRVHGQFFGQSSLAAFAVVTSRCVVRLGDDNDQDIRGQGQTLTPISPISPVSPIGPEDLRALAPLACGYLTGAGTVINVLQPRASDTVAILGMGAVGLTALLATRLAGVKDIVVVDVLDSKLALAKELGASHMINGRTISGSLDESIKAIFPGGVDKIVDTTGVVAVMEASVRALAHGGTLALVGVPPPATQLRIDAQDFLFSCKTVVGVIEAQADPKKLIPKLYRLYKEGKFPIDRLSKCYPATALQEAIQDLHSGKVVKPILSWDDIDRATI